jgi:hypothetical protein
MTLKTVMAADLGTVFFNTNDFADAATYTPTTGDPVPCSVIIDHNALVQADGYEIGVTTLGTTIKAQVSDVGTVARGETFLVDGTTYTVQRIENYSEDGLEVTMVVK